MPTNISKHPDPRSGTGTAAATVERFWAFAQQLASTADVAANASSADLVRAGGKARSKPTDPSKLAAELSSLSEAIDKIRSHLKTGDGNLISARARMGATAAMRKMRKEGSLLDSATFVARRGVTRQALSKALQSHRVFYVEVDAVRYFPSFFLDARLERRQVEEVSRALGELPGAGKLQFFMTGKASLGGKTPVDALIDGQYSRVRVAAQGFAER